MSSATAPRSPLARQRAEVPDRGAEGDPGDEWSDGGPDVECGSYSRKGACGRDVTGWPRRRNGTAVLPLFPDVRTAGSLSSSDMSVTRADMRKGFTSAVAVGQE